MGAGQDFFKNERFSMSSDRHPGVTTADHPPPLAKESIRTVMKSILAKLET